MSSYFRMSDAIFDSPCVVELARRGERDNCAAVRILLFIRILVWGLSTSKFFTDSKALAEYGGVTLMQAQRVWDACVSHGVLRKTGYGYSARQWMIDNNILGKYNSKSESDRAFSEGING
jgi:hypothetical protein